MFRIQELKSREASQHYPSSNHDMHTVKGKANLECLAWVVPLVNVSDTKQNTEESGCKNC